MVNRSTSGDINESAALQQLIDLRDRRRRNNQPGVEIIFADAGNVDNYIDEYASSDEDDTHLDIIYNEMENIDNEGSSTVREEREIRVSAEMSSAAARCWLKGCTRKTNEANWKKVGRSGNPTLPADDVMRGKLGSPIGDTYLSSPINSFDLFFNSEVLTLILRRTNQCAAMFKSREVIPRCMVGWYDLLLPELYDFLTVLMLMALIQLPSEGDYWSIGLLGIHQVASIMFRDRFQAIKKCLSVSNPTQEENKDNCLAKCKPILGLLQKICHTFWHPGRDISLDESQSRCGSRYARCSHRGETKKPLSDYIKIIAVHDSCSGYLTSFVVDTRKQTIKSMLLEVIKKIRSDDGDGACQIATDRFYT